MLVEVEFAFIKDEYTCVVSVYIVKTSRRFLVGLVMCNGIVSDIVTLILVSTFSFRFKLDVDSLTDTNMNVDCLGYEYK